MNTATCPPCAGDWLPTDHRVAEFALSVAYLHEDQFFPGWILLVLKRHATELFELTRDERCQLVEEVSTVAEALKTALGARKINYELLGNQVPHLHWHLVPRLAEDPAPGRAARELPHVPRRLSVDERAARIAQIRACLPR